MCEYCDGECKDFELNYVSMSLDKDGDLCIDYNHGWEGFTEYKHINYCPMCGRKLK